MNEKEFELWAYDKWEEECEDHWIYGEKPISFNKYVKENEEKLRDEFSKIKRYANL